ncbi:MAG TPA: PQQ-binding-like beta-propeller repeat protein, partial [Devosia sp.]|nr:PQQ-binding-like beta-propeller repeat protein [Devosia sp.]
MKLHRLAPMALAIMALTLLDATAIAAPVTGARLAAAASESQNWLMGIGDYGANRYSGLDGLNAANAGKLKLLFTVSLGPISAGDGFEQTRISAPLVDDGMLYVADAFGTVYKIDVTSGVNGKILWSSKPIEPVMDAWLDGQWSLTFSGNSVILAAGDGRLFWFDRDSGAQTQAATIADPATGFVQVAPPLLVDGKLIVGGAGGERGARPQISALDATSGALLWRSFAAEEDGAIIAGGSFLRSGAYDAKSDLTLWATSGPLPAYNPALRRGENATNAVLAVKTSTGEVAWRQNLLETDVMGFNQAATPLLVDGGAVHIGDDGQMRRLNIASGAVELAQPFVMGLATAQAGCPNIIAEEHMPASVSGRTGLVYAAENNGCRADLSAIGNLEGRSEGGHYSNKTVTTGALAAIDPQTGKTVAEHLFDFPLQSGVLSTAGGLVFAATANGSVHVLDDETLDTLWSSHISSFMASPPISYGVDGRQYIALLVGGGPLYSEVSFKARDMVGVRHLT